MLIGAKLFMTGMLLVVAGVVFAVLSNAGDRFERIAFYLVAGGATLAGGSAFGLVLVLIWTL